MRFYIDKNNEMNFEISKAEKKAVKAAIKAYEAGIEHASNVSKDDKQSKLAKYVTENFLDDKSKKIARYSYFNFMYHLKEKLGLN